MKTNRLFGILYLLLSHGMMTAGELADYFEVSVRTIYRDIDALSELNIPVYMTKGKNGGIGLLTHYRLDKTLLNEQEQDLILFSLQQTSGLTSEKSELHEKLQHFFARYEPSWFEADFSIWGHSSSHQAYFTMIKEAILSHRILRFLYVNAKGEQTWRQVEPLKLYFRHNAWYLFAYDQDKADYRLFKIMRMQQMEITAQSFIRQMPSNWQFDQKTINPISLVFKIDPIMAYRVYDEFDPSQITILEDGTFLVHATYPEGEWVYGNILSYGEHLEVLEPVAVRQEIGHRLEKSLKKYL